MVYIGNEFNALPGLKNSGLKFKREMLDALADKPTYDKSLSPFRKANKSHLPKRYVLNISKDSHDFVFITPVL